jgi:hypothetical protein
MSALSRRSLVTSAAALPALAVPAAAIPAATPADFDKAAMVRRAEEIVEVLSTRYVRADRYESFDLDLAAEFLQDVRVFDIKAEDVDHEQKIFAWAREHGVSLDWLLDGDPGSMICSLASYVRPPS